MVLRNGYQVAPGNSREAAGQGRAGQGAPRTASTCLAPACLVPYSASAFSHFLVVGGLYSGLALRK